MINCDNLDRFFCVYKYLRLSSRLGTSSIMRNGSYEQKRLFRSN